MKKYYFTMKLMYILMLLPMISVASGTLHLRRTLQDDDMMEVVEGKCCDPTCMGSNLRCKNWCDVIPNGGGVKCAYGYLPNACQSCCHNCNTPSDDGEDGEMEVDATCSPSCMQQYLTCREKCSWNAIGSVVKCDDGHLPLLCKNKCCTDDQCPEEITCTTECTLKKWSSFYQDCLEDYSEEINKKCVEICKAEAEQECTSSRCISSPDDCEPILDCQVKCCTNKSEEYFKKCREKYDEGESLECSEECAPSDDGEDREMEVDATCSPSCMQQYLTCREKCSWNANGSVVKCDDGHLPLLCKNKCCTDDQCPEEITCTTECTLKKWSSFYQDCLEDYSEEINKKCVEICKAEAEQECTSSRCISSPDDCEPILDCQVKCCTNKSEEYFKKCREKYDEGESLECSEECV